MVEWLQLVLDVSGETGAGRECFCLACEGKVDGV